MQRLTRPAIDYDIAQIETDMTARGWMLTDLAQESGLSNSTIGRFFSGQRRTPRVAKKIANALNHPIRRYIVSREVMTA